MVWLGIETDLKEGCYRICGRRENGVTGHFEVIIGKLPYVSAKEVSKLAGKLISTKFVLGNVVRFKNSSIVQNVLGYENQCYA